MRSEPVPNPAPPTAAGDQDAIVRLGQPSSHPQPRAQRSERRRWSRAPVRLPVQVLLAQTLHRYVAENLSASGALLVDGPVLAIGTQFELALSINAQLCRVRARVVRVQQDSRGRRGFAVTFPRIEPNLQDAIQGHVLAFLRRRARHH